MKDSIIASRRSFLGATALAGAALGLAGIASARASEAQTAETADEDPLDDGVFTYAIPRTSTVEERRANHRRVLVVVDYQVDFVDGGVFERIEPAVAIEDALYDLVKEYQDEGDIVIYTMDTHPSDTYDLTREATVNPPHCVPGTPGWEVYGRLAELLTPERGAICVKKGTFGSPDLPFVIQAIRDQGVAVESIEMAGVSTTCRVLHNAILLYTYFPELPIIFDPRTTASYTDERTAEQLEELEAWGFVVRHPDGLAAGSSAAAGLPPASPDPASPFGIDLNVNMDTIDNYIGRTDIVFRDMRMVHDPADYAAIGGSPNLDIVLEGFKVVPFPYVGTLQELPVEGAYDGPTLFDVAWNDDGTVASATPRYEESLTIVQELFPQDRPVVLMCGGAGYASMMRQLLVYLGWDPARVYNAGGEWDYTGYRAVPIVDYAGDEPRFYLWRTDIATIEFDQYRPISR